MVPDDLLNHLIDLPTDLNGVQNAIDDYQRMRYGLCSCLLDDGYFSYTDEAEGYSAIPWFDEYDVDLGQPIEPPKHQPIKGSFFWNRKYENGIVYLNPTSTPSSIKCEPGYRRIEGTQAPDVNTGSVAGWVNLGAKDGIVLVKA